MTASELIAKLQEMMALTGADPEVRGQSHGCCPHGHAIEAVEMGAETYRGIETRDEMGVTIIRV